MTIFNPNDRRDENLEYINGEALDKENYAFLFNQIFVRYSLACIPEFATNPFLSVSCWF